MTTTTTCRWCGYPSQYSTHASALVCLRVRAETAEKERDQLRATWRSVKDEIQKTRQWRKTTGMKTATDVSAFSSLPPSALIHLDRLADYALGLPITKGKRTKK